MKNPFNNLLTGKEQKILGYLGAIMIMGMIIQYTGFSSIYANKTNSDKQELSQATEKDSLILIDIRTADTEELILLPGIGEKRAADIISYRKAKQFESAEELLNIKGIGAKTYLKMKPMLLSFGISGQGVADKVKLESLQTLETSPEGTSPATAQQELDGTDPFTKKEQGKSKSVNKDSQSIVYLNSASRQDLMSLNGIGEVKADAIIEYRKQIGKFTSVEQLLQVKGIGPKTLEKNRHRLNL